MLAEQPVILFCGAPAVLPDGSDAQVATQLTGPLCRKPCSHVLLVHDGPDAIQLVLASRPWGLLNLCDRR